MTANKWSPDDQSPDTIVYNNHTRHVRAFLLCTLLPLHLQSVVILRLSAYQGETGMGERRRVCLFFKAGVIFEEVFRLRSMGTTVADESHRSRDPFMVLLTDATDEELVAAGGLLHQEELRQAA